MIGSVGEGLFELGLDEAEPVAPPRVGYGGDAANTAVMAAASAVRDSAGGSATTRSAGGCSSSGGRAASTRMPSRSTRRRPGST